jgi:hypothetical protein
VKSIKIFQIPKFVIYRMRDFSSPGILLKKIPPPEPGAFALSCPARASIAFKSLTTQKRNLFGSKEDLTPTKVLPSQNFV